jgi:hypothetical protein
LSDVLLRHEILWLLVDTMAETKIKIERKIFLLKRVSA